MKCNLSQQVIHMTTYKHVVAGYSYGYQLDSQVVLLQHAELQDTMGMGCSHLETIACELLISYRCWSIESVILELYSSFVLIFLDRDTCFVMTLFNKSGYVHWSMQMPGVQPPF